MAPARNANLMAVPPRCGTLTIGVALIGYLDRRVWCRADPLFLVGSKVVDVTIGSQFGMVATASGPVRIKLTTSKGGLLSPQVRVEVPAPSAADLPVSVYFTRIGVLGKVELTSVETQGRSNAWVATSWRSASVGAPTLHAGAGVGSISSGR